MFNPCTSKLSYYNILTNTVPKVMLCDEAVEVVQSETKQIVR